MINIHELYEIKKKKELRHLNAFKHILNICNRKIKEVAEHGGMSLYYNIPPVIIGYPLYEHKTCIEYIMKELKKTGLYIALLPPPNSSYIYISWKLQDISSKAKSRLLLE